MVGTQQCLAQGYSRSLPRAETTSRGRIGQGGGTGGPTPSFLAASRISCGSRFASRDGGYDDGEQQEAAPEKVPGGQETAAGHLPRAHGSPSQSRQWGEEPSAGKRETCSSSFQTETQKGSVVVVLSRFLSFGSPTQTKCKLLWPKFFGKCAPRWSQWEWRVGVSVSGEKEEDTSG